MVRVRGLRAPQAAPVRHCLHCGTPLAHVAGNHGDFCCAGCSYVHRLVHEHGLDSYYKIRDPIVAPVDAAVFQARDFAWLGELQSAAEKAGDTPTLELEIQGISCAGCVWLIENLFHQQPGALHIETDAQLGRLRLRWTIGEFDATAFARTLHAFNYLAGPPGESPPVMESRLLTRRIGLSAAFAMNVMLFTLPTYFGMAHDFAYARLFGLLAMAFASFSVFTGGAYFVKRAWGALRAGTMHIDLPIALGIVGTFLGSLYGLLLGREDLVYFDFVTGFILLMLVGRWAQTVAVERNRHRLLSGQGSPKKVRVTTDGSTTERPLAELGAGDIFSIRPGEVIPVEARLESENAELGTAWINGEAGTRPYSRGLRVPSGAVNVGRGEIQLRALQTWEVSLLAQLLKPARREGYRHRFLERVIQGYLTAIFAIAAGTGLAWWWQTHDPVQTGSVVIAVLVVSCPCAIGLAFPLTDELAACALRRRGVYVREADLWPRLARIRKIIFDKTGTLTLENPELENPEAINRLSDEQRAILFALVENSAHPISQSLCAFLLAQGAATMVTPPAATKLHEIPGSGVCLQHAGKVWSLGRAGWLGGIPAKCRVTGNLSMERNGTEFACDGVVLARLRFADAVRPDAANEIRRLRERGLDPYILSGDRSEKVQTMAARLGISAGAAFAEMTPTRKAECVQRLDDRDTLMVGDGANDSLAFDAAFVRGTPAIHRGVLEGKSDFYYLGQGLGGLDALFAIAARHRQTQAALLIFSVTYNLTVVSLAASGHMNPLFAAVLMPVSSLANLAIVGLGMRNAIVGS